jgi:hypothetical protein
VQRPLRLVDHLVELAPGLVDDIVHLVLHVVQLLFGLSSATIGLTFRFEILVAGKASSCLFDVPITC